MLKNSLHSSWSLVKNRGDASLYYGSFQLGRQCRPCHLLEQLDRNNFNSPPARLGIRRHLSCPCPMPLLYFEVGGLLAFVGLCMERLRIAGQCLAVVLCRDLLVGLLAFSYDRCVPPPFVIIGNNSRSFF